MEKTKLLDTKKIEAGNEIWKRVETSIKEGVFDDLFLDEEMAALILAEVNKKDSEYSLWREVDDKKQLKRIRVLNSKGEAILDEDYQLMRNFKRALREKFAMAQQEHVE